MNRTILLILILAAGIGILISANIFRDTNPGPIVNNPETIEPTESPSPEPTLQPNPEPSFKPSPSSSPATCQISGEIVFLTENIYENKGAKIVYQNVDDRIRQIYWKSNPNDENIRIGPNLFEELVIPNGERDVGVAFTKKPNSKKYTLTASITYGIRNANGVIEEKIADCVGKINVDLSNI